MELVILAAGMGSRFGGLKQLEPIDDNGNFIIDYSIFDAIRCGFDKVIFIIKEENYEIFRETVGKRVENKIKTEYVFQNNNNFPENITPPKDRIKPFGTGHAVLCAADKISDNFAVINSDDFYGYEAFKELAEFLRNKANDNKYAIVGYDALKTMSEFGSVKRGVITTKNGLLQKVTESVLTKNENNEIFATPVETPDDEKVKLEKPIVQVNFFGATRKFVDHLKDHFEQFLNQNKEDLSSCEFFLPYVVSDLINEEKAEVDVIETSATWLGVTYKEDKDYVVNSLKNFVNCGLYPADLWN